MARLSGIFLLLFCTTAFADTENWTIKETNLFEYSAIVESVVKKPVEHTSQYQINAHLHIIPEDINFVKAALKDVQYTLFAGKNGQHSTKMFPISAESEAIEIPFAIEYNDNVEVKNILTQPTDKEWSINIKKGIATLLQNNMEQIQKNQNSKTFISSEKTVYGDCDVQYKINPIDRFNFNMTKYFSSKNCNNFKWINTYNTDDVSECENSYPKRILVTNDIQYQFLQNNTEFFLNELNAINKIMVHSNHGQKDTLFVIVSQNLKFVYQDPSDFEIIRENLIPQSLEMKLHSTEVPFEALPDLTGGRSSMKMEVIMPQMRLVLSDIVKFLSKSQINPGEPDWQHRNKVVNALQYLRMLDKDCFNHCFEALSSEKSVEGKETFEVFLQILPKVGSHASIKFIYETILEDKVNENIASTWLQEVPSYAKYPDSNLLKSLWSDVHFSVNIPSDLKYIAMLSFSSLISKAIKHFPESEKQYDEYIDFFLEEFKSPKTDLEQLQTVGCLHNIASVKVCNYLENIIRNETYDSHIRYHSIWACKDYHKKNNQISNIHWPLLTDTSETLKIRSAALSIILEDYNLDNYMRLYNFMLHESDQYLYSYYFTALKSLSEIESPCYTISTKNAKIILELISEPVTFIENSYEYVDFYDKENSWGAITKISYVTDCKSQDTIIYLQTDSYASYFAKNEFAIYLRIFIDEQEENRMNPEKLIDILMPSITGDRNTLEGIDLKLELSIFKNNKMIDLIQTNEVRKIFKRYNLAEFKKGAVTKYLIDNNLEGETILPTLLGVPVVSYVTSPSIWRLKWDLKREKPSENSYALKTNIVLSAWNNWLYGLKVYNPLSDIWHGSQHIGVQNAFLPIAADFTVNLEQKTFKMVIHREPQNKYGRFGIQNFTNSEVYLQDIGESDTIKNVCPDCLAVYPVTKGISYRRRHVWHEEDVNDTGIKYRGILFGCEKTLSKARLHKLGEDTSSTLFSNIWAWPYSISSSLSYDFCGSALYGEFDQNSNFSSISLLLKASNELVTKDEKIINKSNLKLSYSIRDDKNEPIKSWDLNLNLDSANLRPITIKAYFIKSELNKPNYKICLDASNSFKSNVLEMNAKILAGDYNENSKCPSDIKYDIELEGSLSEQQKQIESGGGLNYFACDPLSKLSNPFSCTFAQTSLRHYTMNVSHSQLDENHTEFWYELSNLWMNLYGNEFIRKVDMESHLLPNSHQIIVEYPVESNDIDVVYKRKEEIIEFNGIIITPFYEPYSPHISTWFYINFLKKNTISCSINSEDLTNIVSVKFNHKVSSEWETYLDIEEWKVLIKKYNEEQLEVRIIVGNKTLDIKAEKNGFKFYLDEKEAGSKLSTGFDSISVFQYKVIEKEHKIIIHTINENIYLDFDGSRINIYMNSELHGAGFCFETSHC